MGFGYMALSIENWRQWVLSSVAMGIVLLIPVIIMDNYIVHLIIVSVVWASVVTNWNLTLGYGGMFHIAQPTFFVMGAYGAGMSAVHLGISSWLCLPIGGATAMIFSLLIGIPCLRVKGIYLILLTYAFHFTVSEAVFHLRRITGGSMGLVIPTFELGKIEFSSINLTAFYYLAVVILAVSILLTYLIIRAPLGKALIATRDSEVLAPSIGINLFKYKLITFTVAAFMSGVTGAFYAFYLMVIGPEMFSFSIIVNGFGMIVIGGIGTIGGPIVGSFVVTFLSELFRGLEDFRPIIVGTIIILVVIFAPDGIIKWAQMLIEKIKLKKIRLKPAEEEIH
jgi:branched-chain amino acid transport system permease protein